MDVRVPAVSSLRALDRCSAIADLGPTVSAHEAAQSALWTAVATGLSAWRTPAWTERHVLIIDRLIAGLGNRPDVTTAAEPLGALLVLHGLRSMVAADHRRGGRDHSSIGTAPDVPQPEALAARAAESLRHSDPAGPVAPAAGLTIREGMVSWRDPLVEGALLGLGLWLQDRRSATDWHAESFAPWLARAAAAIDAATGERAANLAWLLTPQAPGAVEPRLESLAGAGSTGTTSAVQWLLAQEWSLGQQGPALAGPGGAGPLGPDHDDLLGAARTAAANLAAPGRWASLCRGPLASTGQVVDIEFPTLALHRAEWTNGFLTVGLDVGLDVGLHGDSSASGRRSTFRIVGTEPRVWWASGLANITTEMSAASVSVTFPLVSATIEFAPSSY